MKVHLPHMLPILLFKMDKVFLAPLCSIVRILFFMLYTRDVLDFSLSATYRGCLEASPAHKPLTESKVLMSHEGIFPIPPSMTLLKSPLKVMSGI